jgi:hypothetical protein
MGLYMVRRLWRRMWGDMDCVRGNLGIGRDQDLLSVRAVESRFPTRRQGKIVCRILEAITFITQTVLELYELQGCLESTIQPQPEGKVLLHFGN